jgi:hypothetical protein
MSKAPAEKQAEPRLEQVQRWMQSVLMHRGGVAEGVDAAESRQHIDITLEQLPNIIRPSESLSSADRLEIYVNAYHARLLECLDEEFSVTRWTMGDELFGAVAFGYLQSYPSRSYTLNQLGARFPQYLSETRLHAAGAPAGVGPSWPEFVIELATLERSLYEVYDGPGTEQAGPLDANRLADLPADAWGDLRLIAAPCLRLHRFAHAVSAYWGAQKNGEEPVVDGPQPTWLAINRREFVVERHELSPVQFALLEALLEGRPLAGAIEAATALPGAEAESIEAQLGPWFSSWMAAGFFADCALPSGGPA